MTYFFVRPPQFIFIRQRECPLFFFWHDYGNSPSPTWVSTSWDQCMGLKAPKGLPQTYYTTYEQSPLAPPSSPSVWIYFDSGLANTLYRGWQCQKIYPPPSYIFQFYGTLFYFHTIDPFPSVKAGLDEFVNDFLEEESVFFRPPSYLRHVMNWLCYFFTLPSSIWLLQTVPIVLQPHIMTIAEIKQFEHSGSPYHHRPTKVCFFLPLSLAHNFFSPPPFFYAPLIPYPQSTHAPHLVPFWVFELVLLFSLSPGITSVFLVPFRNPLDFTEFFPLNLSTNWPNFTIQLSVLKLFIFAPLLL